MQTTANIEQPVVARTTEFSIDQKIPLQVNSTSESNVSLKPLGSDPLSLQGRETTIQDSSTNVLKSNEIRNGNNIADQIAWAQRANAQQLRIAVSPEHLGTVEIKIDDTIEGLNIQFVTQNLPAKEALESFIPRLKEMLEQSGLNLQNANVSQQGEGKSQFNLSDRTTEQELQDQQAENLGANHSAVNSADQPSTSTHLLDAFA